MNKLRDSLRSITAEAPLWPLAILFGLVCVDEFDRTAFGLLTPDIRDYFHLNNERIFAVISIIGIVGIIGALPIGYFADRVSRVRIAVAGAIVWGAFTLLTGIPLGIAAFIVFRSLTGLGRAVNDPTHNSLLSDYYPPAARVSVFYVYRYGIPLGVFLGFTFGGLLASIFHTWRAPFLIFWAPTAVFDVLALWKLRDPIRGAFERAAMGATADTIATEEAAPSYGEAWRICNQVKSLRRIWYSLPFFAISLFGFGSISSILFHDRFHVTVFRRGLIGAATEPLQLIGVVIGIKIATKYLFKDPGKILTVTAITSAITAVTIIGLALSPNVWVAIGWTVLFTIPGSIIVPGIYAVLSLTIPPRARSLGFSIGGLWVLPGLVLFPVVGGLADKGSLGIRGALIVAVAPIFLIGAAIIASAGQFVDNDIRKVRASSVAQSEVLAARRAGQVKLLLVKDLDVSYSGTQVLFGVNFEIDEGEIVALLGTNGAGKTTLLKSISGLVEADAGAIVFDGRDMTYATPNEIAGRGVVQVPGGKGAFPSLTVAENLRLAGWLYQGDDEYLKAATEEVLGFFPVLRERWEQPAGTLSGGEQQMLTLGQAFIAKPRLLMIDELSLGLAPIIVEQLLEIVRAIRAHGTTIILVEQSVNVALTLAETAYFMEKGEIRFHGSTSELLNRPDIVRSVFLEGAQAAMGNGNGRRPKTAARTKRAPEVAGRPVLQIDGLHRSFGGITAVDDVTLDLKEGEILGVIGPNGAGKTTLFDLVSGFIAPDSGRIALEGRDITHMSPEGRARHGLGRSFQDARLFPALTVEEAVKLALERQVEVRDPVAAALNLPMVGDSEAKVQSRADELIQLMGLDAFRDKFISELSTGSRRIVDLACVLAHDPKVLLFDEPSSGIAQRESEALVPLLLRIREATGASLLLIEHDMPLVTSVADEILALDLGRVIVRGRPQDVVHHPAVVESYLGTSEAAIARSGKQTKPRSKSRAAAGSRKR